MDKEDNYLIMNLLKIGQIKVITNVLFVISDKSGAPFLWYTSRVCNSVDDTFGSNK